MYLINMFTENGRRFCIRMHRAIKKNCKDQLKLLGAGGYGKVLKVNLGNKEVAVKCQKRNSEWNKQIHENEKSVSVDL